MNTFRRAAFGFVLAAVAAALGGCSETQRLPPDPWIVEVATATRQVDRLLDANDTEAARALLRTLVADQRASPELADDRRVALEDCYFRLAHLALTANDPHQALADAERGLSYQTADSLFVANLLVARGAAHEALRDPRSAAEDYHRALVMNERLLQQALGRP